MRTVFLIMVLVMTSGSTPLGAQASDTVALRFDWPVGMTARVEQTWTRMQSTPTRRDSTTVRSTYRMRVVEHPRGLLVQSDSFRVVEVAAPGTDSTAKVDAARVLDRLGSFMPSYVVSEEGEFLELANVDVMKQAIDSLFGPVRQEVRNAPPELEALLANATSPQVLTAAAAQEWYLVAGTWVDAEWEIGQTYGYSADEPIPVFPGRTVAMNYEFEAVGRDACTDEASAPRCVRLEMRSAPDSAALQALLREVLVPLMPNDKVPVTAPGVIRSLNEVTVVTEPGTLRPHSVELRKYVEVTIPPGSADPAGISVRLDVRSFRYIHDE